MPESHARGRPHMTWLESIVSSTGFKMEESIRMAKESNGERLFVMQPKAMMIMMIANIIFLFKLHLVCKNSSYSQYVLWIYKGESHKFCLIEIHYKQFICWCKFWQFTGEFPVKIADIIA